MDATAQFIFEGAIDDNRTAVVSIRDGKETRSLLGQFSHREPNAFCFETPFWPDTQTPTAGQKAAFEFGTSGAAVTFEAEVLGMHKKGDIVRVRCANPEKITVVQRRSHFRVPVPAGAPIDLAVWKVPNHWVLRDRPKPSKQLQIEMVDISLGGMCLKILPGRAGPETVAHGDRLRMGMKFEDSEVLFDGLIVYRSNSYKDGSVRIGISFQKLETSIEGRRAAFLLDRVIATLQRNAIKETAVA